MTRPRLTAALATSLLLASITTGAAAAQSPVTVSTGYADAHRHVLEVTDLAGANLTTLALTPGQPRTFRVGVRTTAPTLLAAPATALSTYTVESTMTNLYQVDGEGKPRYGDTSPRIASADVSLSYATSPLEVRDALGRVTPRYVLSTAAAIDCTSLAGVVSLPTSALTLGGLCDPLKPLAAVSFTDVVAEGRVLDAVPLTSLSLDQLPLTPRGGVQSGPYTVADCQRGVGEDDPGCGGGQRTGGTELTMLSASKPTELDLAALSGAARSALPTTPALPLVSATGEGALMRVDQALTALQRSTTTAVSSLGNRLATDFGVADQITILNRLVTAGAPNVSDATDLIGFSALNSTYPSLTVAPEVSDRKAGSYTGTLTVRLVECPPCS